MLTYFPDRLLGVITGADGGYRPDPAHPRDTELAPDVAFVRKDRVPDHASPDYPKAWPITPDLAVEVASPNQYRPGMGTKAKLYLSFGTRLVWVVWPRWQQVDVWRPGDARPSVTLSIGDVLDGLDVVPGFTYPVEKLFA
jgi:Uma2 family endonuclease